MKKIILLLLVALNISAWAQIKVASPADFETFKKSKLLVVKIPNEFSSFNFAIEDVVKKNWTLSPYEIVDASKIGDYRRKPGYAILTVKAARFLDAPIVQYDMLTLELSNPKAQSEKDNPELISVPLSYIDDDSGNYAFKLEAFVRFIQLHVETCLKNKDLKDNAILKYYKKNAPPLKDKILYITKEDLSPEVNTIEKVKKNYPYEVKFASEDEIKTAIATKDPKVVFLHKVGPAVTGKKKARCWKMAFGAADGWLYYFDFHIIKPDKPDGFLKGDIGDLK